ncbi:uncharacterized protein [Halyomorpha halys]|uniref:uncharacterized protein isoform X1 n=1 Tax=Halyomorpha halys TaxID=286706 RepID=UPI0006D4F279|nr:uncharacterized protein LOC106677967 isoform X1 [Halyomorpha halys]XP_024215410.1 uncharacterized protein LOC106677967 isoform X1 [Halyomorpha halys]
MEWSEEILMKLINAYRKKPILWHHLHNDRFKKQLKADAWYEIAAEMDIPLEQCKKKLESLLGSYRRERCRTRNSMNEGKESSEVYKSKWFAYKAFGFLKGRSLPTNKAEVLDGDKEETLLQTEELEDEEVQLKRSYEDSIQNEEPLATPKPPKRLKIRDIRSENSKLLADAFQLLQNATAMIATPPEDDEVSAFFKYVATKVKSFPPEIKRGVQKAVFDILMKADEGIYECASEND